MRWIFFLLPSLIVASVNEPFCWELQTGYRNDKIQWHLQTDDEGSHLSYSEHYKNLQFWENALVLRVINRDVIFLLKGSGAFGSGDMHLASSVNSWAADAVSYFGYAVNLTADRLYKVILVPLVGYGVDYEHVGLQRMCWFGPLFGGLFLIEPGHGMRYEAGYCYHLLRLNFRASWKVSTPEENNAFIAKDGHNLAHSGWLKAQYSPFKYWRFGIFTEMQYFTSRILPVKVKNQINRASQEEKLKVRWTAVSVATTISRDF